MRTELRLMPHRTRHGEHTIEVWYNHQLLATVVGADGPRIRVLSHNHRLATSRDEEMLDEGHHLYVEIVVDGHEPRRQ